jgi:threonine dehydratase
MLAEIAHLVVEPSGAVSFAGAMKLKESFKGKRVCAVLSGGNIDFGSCQLGQIPG